MSEESEQIEADVSKNDEEKDDHSIASKNDSLKTRPVPRPVPHHLLPPQEEESILRRSLKEIGEDMKKMEDLITLTEDIIRRERERDREFYLRERRRKMSENATIPKQLFQVQHLQSTQKQQQFNEQIDEEIDTEQATTTAPSPKRNSPLTLRQKITKHFRRNSTKCEQPKSTKAEQSTNQKRSSPTYKIINSATKSKTKSNLRKKLIRFSPRKCRSRLYFRNGKIGCIDAENVTQNQTNIEKTHAIIKYITSDLERIDVSMKRSSLTSNISDILSEESTPSFDDIPNSNSYFNFDCSPGESDDRGVTDEDFFVNSLSDIDSFTVHKTEVNTDQEAKNVIEVNVKEEAIDEEMANASTAMCLNSSSIEPAFVNYEDELTIKDCKDLDEKGPMPPDSAMSNHSVGT